MSRALLALAVSLAASPAFAAEEDLPPPNAQDLSGSRALAMGDAFRAVATSNEAIYLNLAGLATTQKYEVDAAYALNRATDLSRINVSVTDSRTSRVAAGAAYTRLTGDTPGGNVNGSIAHLGLAFPFSDAGAIGLGAKYLNFSKPEETNAVTGDLGLMIRAGEWVSIGAAGYNLIDVGSPEAPLGAGAGLAVGTDTEFRIALDGAVDLSREEDVPLTLSAGGEYLIANTVVVRLGFKRKDAEERNYLGGGLGFVSTGLALDATYVQNLGEDESSDRLLAATLKLFL